MQTSTNTLNKLFRVLCRSVSYLSVHEENLCRDKCSLWPGADDKDVSEDGPSGKSLFIKRRKPALSWAGMEKKVYLWFISDFKAIILSYVKDVWRRRIRCLTGKSETYVKHSQEIFCAWKISETEQGKTTNKKMNHGLEELNWLSKLILTFSIYRKTESNSNMWPQFFLKLMWLHLRFEQTCVMLNSPDEQVLRKLTTNSC